MSPTDAPLVIDDLATLRARLAEAEETLRAIGSGEVDALIGTGGADAPVFTLSNADEAYRALIESMNEGALTLTTDKIILYANAGFAKMVQRPLAQVIGASFKEFLAEEDHAPLRALLKTAGKEGSKVELILQLAEGGTMPVLISVRCLAENGTAHKTVAMVVTDMTEQRRNEKVLRENQVISSRKAAETQQRESEERFRSVLRTSEIRYRRLFETTKDGVIILDGQTLQITEANPFILKVLGRSRAEVLGRELWEIGVFEDATASRAAMAELQQRGYLRYEDLPLVSKMGQRREVEVVANVYQEDNQRVIQCNIRDISERKRTEEQLRLRDRAIAATNAGVFIVDAKAVDFPIVFSSGGFERMTGYTAADVRGQNCRFLQGRDTDRATVARIREAVHSGSAIRVTLLNYHKDGTPFWNDLSISPVRDAKGLLTHFVGIQNDVTEQRELQASLRASELRLSLGVKIAGFALAEVDYATGLNHLSAEAARVYGLGDEAMVVPRASIHATFHPDDRDALARSIEDSLDPAGLGWFAMDHRVVWPSGEVHWLRVRKQVFFTGQGHERRPHRATLAALDITEAKLANDELKASQSRVQIAMEATAVGIWEWNLKTDTIHWDAQMFRIYGIAPTADGFVQYSDWSNAVSPDDITEQARIIHETVSRGGQGHRAFRIYRRDDGASRDIEAAETVRKNECGEAEWLVGTNLDVTKRNQAEARLKNALQLAEAASKAKDKFLAALSHELRTPLTPVLMTATALASDPSLPVEARAQLDMMRRNIELEARLIDDLLDLSRIIHGKLILERITTDIHDLLVHTAEIIRSDGLDKQLHVVLKLEATHHHALVDPARLQQVFWNLLKNSVKFTPMGGTITVSTRNDAEGEICISVADDGIGIRAEVLLQIFDAFEQADTTGEHCYGGLGLGLAISSAIVIAHDGQIKAESLGCGHGADFSVTLDTVPAPAATQTTLAAPHQSACPLDLLVVEDHEASRMVLELLLTRSGHRVTTAASVQEALTAFKAAHFDVVISDLGLPDGSGMELMVQLQKIRPVLGIALSGYGREIDLQRSKEAGFFVHLVKPINVDQLKLLLTQLPELTAPRESV